MPSSEPAVVFASLAALSVPAFSDQCQVVLEEVGGVRYRIMRPIEQPRSGAAWLGEQHTGPIAQSGQIVSEDLVLTPIRCGLLGAELDFWGVVVHFWRSDYRPSPADAALAQLLVDHATALICAQRLLTELVIDQRDIRVLRDQLANLKGHRHRTLQSLGIADVLRGALDPPVDIRRDSTPSLDRSVHGC